MSKRTGCDGPLYTCLPEDLAIADTDQALNEFIAIEFKLRPRPHSINCSTIDSLSAACKRSYNCEYLSVGRCGGFMQVKNPLALRLIYDEFGAPRSLDFQVYGLIAPRLWYLVWRRFATEAICDAMIDVRLPRVTRAKDKRSRSREVDDCRFLSRASNMESVDSECHGQKYKSENSAPQRCPSRSNLAISSSGEAPPNSVAIQTERASSSRA